MKIIRASEIGSYLYCRRAWWYRQQGLEPGNQAELNAGTELHRQHGRRVLAAGLQRGLAWLFMLAALILLAWLGVQNLLGG
jgi:CRISPR/Cas system-associated exonuclease Cas4 (RecB family)